MAITERYVSTTGAGSHDGTSEANAYSWAEMLTAIAGGAAAGYRYNVKQGTYSLSSTSSITASGTTTSPLVIRGYKTTPGDGARGWSAGALDTSYMPTIAYDANYYLGFSGSFVFVEALVVTANNAGKALQAGPQCVFHQVRAANSSTAGTSYVVGLDETMCLAVACEFGLTGASGGDCVAYLQANGASMIGCRIFQSSAIGVKAYYFSSILGCVFQNCAGKAIKQSDTGGGVVIYGNTVQGNTSDGIEIVASTTTLSRIVNNHITDNGAYAANFNGTAAPCFMYNRTRDNTSGATSGGTDWISSLAGGNVTTDNGSASSDYTNAGSGDVSLVAAAVGAQAGVGYKSAIGACGPASLGSTGGLKGYAAA